MRAAQIGTCPHHYDLANRLASAQIPLVDTDAEDWVLRNAFSDGWNDFGRGQDYYEEDLLIWLRADTIGCPYPVLRRRRPPSTGDKSFGIPFVHHTPILLRCAFSRLDHGSRSLRPVVLLALLSEVTRLPSGQRGRLHPGFQRFWSPARRYH